MHIPLGQYWALLARHIRPQKTRFTLLTVLLLGGIALQLATPQIVRSFIDLAASGQGSRALIVSALAFIGTALLLQVVTVSTTYVGESVAWTATNALRAELAHHCLHLDMGFHNQNSPGKLIERIDGDVAQLSTFFSQVVVHVLGNLLLLAGILVALSVEDWRAGLAFALFALVSLLALNRFRGISVPHYKARRQAEADLFGYLEEQLSGTEDIRSSGATDFSLRGLYRLQHEVLRHDRKASLLSQTIGIVTAALLTLAQVMAVLIGYDLHRRGAITVGTVYLFVQYINLLSRPIRELARQVQDLQTIGASIERLTELRQTQSAIQDGPGAEFDRGPLALRFEDVCFSYVTDEPVIQDMSFDLAPGRVLGLLGRTGSGKTTLARLIFRLYDPEGGQIALGGVDVRQPRVRELRRRVAIVTQDVQLFQASVRDNLTFFERSIADEQIHAVIAQLGLAGWYASLPQGLDTQLEMGAGRLSAGEAQLLAFARVFLSDPGLVILDEASSRLDLATEQLIERAIDRLLENRTAIVIAHRLGTIHRADEIMILEQGRVSEHGDRKQLARDPTSRFYGLLQTGMEEMLA